MVDGDGERRVVAVVVVVVREGAMRLVRWFPFLVVLLMAMVLAKLGMGLCAIARWLNPKEA